MQLDRLDWAVVAVYGVVALAVGLMFTRRAGQGVQEFFLSGRKLPWWLLGTSMVATTFSTDTPNLVTDLVRNGGVSQNWLWWAFLITGMLTVFIYAKLWRRSGVLTDIGFYELRYSGKPAAFLRGFRALYLGIFFNVMIMATVTLAAIKIGNVLLGRRQGHDGRAGRRGDRHLLRHRGPLGRGGDRLVAVRHRHDRLDRRGVLRLEPARGGRVGRYGAASGARGKAEPATRFLGRHHRARRP